MSMAWLRPDLEAAALSFVALIPQMSFPAIVPAPPYPVHHAKKRSPPSGSAILLDHVCDLPDVFFPMSVMT